MNTRKLFLELLEFHGGRHTISRDGSAANWREQTDTSSLARRQATDRVPGVG